MNWYNKVFTDEKEKDKINKLPRITNYLPDEGVDLKTELDVIFSDYFADYSKIAEDPNLKINPGNISMDSRYLYIVNTAASFFTEGSNLNKATIAVTNFAFSFAATPVNWAKNLIFGTSNLQDRTLRGGSTTLSHKPNTKNKKTKKLIRDKR
jgi:hypothetical protein